MLECKEQRRGISRLNRAAAAFFGAAPAAAALGAIANESDGMSGVLMSCRTVA